MIRSRRFQIDRLEAAVASLDAVGITAAVGALLQFSFVDLPSALALSILCVPGQFCWGSILFTINLFPLNCGAR